MTIRSRLNLARVLVEHRAIGRLEHESGVPDHCEVRLGGLSRRGQVVAGSRRTVREAAPGHSFTI